MQTSYWAARPGAATSFPLRMLRTLGSGACSFLSTVLSQLFLLEGISQVLKIFFLKQNLSFYVLILSKKFSLFTEFVGVTPVDKTTQVSGAQPHNTPSVHPTMCVPRVRAPPSPPPPHPAPPAPCPLPHRSPHTVVRIREIFLVFSVFLSPCTSSSPRPPQALSACSLPKGLSLYCLIVHFVH